MAACVLANAFVIKLKRKREIRLSREGSDAGNDPTGAPPTIDAEEAAARPVAPSPIMSPNAAKNPRTAALLDALTASAHEALRPLDSPSRRGLGERPSREAEVVE